MYLEWHNEGVDDFEIRIDPNVPYFYEFRGGQWEHPKKVKFPEEFTGIPEEQRVHYEHLDFNMKTVVYEAFNLCNQLQKIAE